MNNLKILLPLLFLIHLSISQSCLGEGGKPVDWWVVLKTTKTSGYGYYDSTMDKTASAFKVTYVPFTTTQGPVARTLTQINILKNMEATAWSDQPPDGNAGSTYAHSKGLIAFSRNNRKGFAIEHSLPQFPQFFANNSINHMNKNNSNVYGQSIFCQSLDIQNLNTIAGRFLTVKPYVYFSSVKLTGSPSTINLENLSSKNNKNQKSSSALNYIDYTVGSTNVKGVFKASGFDYSIFGDHAKNAVGLPKLLGSSLYVQTWRGDDGDFCNLQSKQDDNVIYVNEVQLGSISWRRTADHSKWVVSLNGEWSCIGGMNRQKSQWKRGGQFFCIKSKGLNRAFSSIIKQASSCGRQNSTRGSVSTSSSNSSLSKLKRRNSWSMY